MASPMPGTAFLASMALPVLELSNLSADTVPAIANNAENMIIETFIESFFEDCEGF